MCSSRRIRAAREFAAEHGFSRHNQPMTTFSTAATATTQSTSLSKAALIYEYTHTAASSLLTAFDDAKTKRGNVRGVLTDQEQDILRAALVMSCAGLDAAIKQAIRDCIEELLQKEKAVRDGFEKFIRKRISGEGDLLEVSQGARFLASVLADPTPRKKLIEGYIKDLTGESLQSTEEVLRTLAALGLDHKALKLDIARLKEIFGIRNKIIHELDIDLNAKKRKRKVRSQTDLLDNADEILSATKAIIEGLNAKL